MKADEFLNEDGGTVSGAFAATVMPLGNTIRRIPKKKKKRVDEMDKSQKGPPGWNISDEPYTPEPVKLDIALRRHMLKKLAWETDWDLSDLEHLTDKELADLYHEKVADARDFYNDLKANADKVFAKKGLKGTMESLEESKSWEDYGMPTAEEEPKKKPERRLHSWLEYEEEKDKEKKKPQDKETVTEAPINLDRDNPTNPEIYGHHANRADLDTRRLRALSQLKDMAKRAESAQEYDSLLMWKTIVANFPELAMNIGEIDHAIQELEKIRRKGGTNSRGIPDLS